MRSFRGLGLPVVAENGNVGQHLSDHQGINYTWSMKVPTYNDELRPTGGAKLIAGMKYVLAGAGPLAKSINHAVGSSAPGRASTGQHAALHAGLLDLIPRDGERPILSPDPWSGLSLGLSNCRPTSRGHIRIRTADPMAHPVIVANAFATNHDVQEMLKR